MGQISRIDFEDTTGEVFSPAGYSELEQSKARHPSLANDSITIDCNSCVMQATSACEECIVTFICDRDPGGVILKGEERFALRRLANHGLIGEFPDTLFG